MLRTEMELEGLLMQQQQSYAINIDDSLKNTELQQSNRAAMQMLVTWTTDMVAAQCL